MINQHRIDQNVINQHVIDRNAIDHDVIDQHVVNQHVIDQNTTDQNVIDRNVIDHDVIDQHVVNQHVIDQNTTDQNVNPIDTYPAIYWALVQLSDPGSHLRLPPGLYPDQIALLQQAEKEALTNAPGGPRVDNSIPTAFTSRDRKSVV